MRGRTDVAGLFVIGTIGIVGGGLGALGCARGAPPAPEGVDATVAPLPGPATAPLDATDAPPTAEVPLDAGDATRAAAASSGDASDPGSLPQTRDRPAPSSHALHERAAALWDAIVHDDPERAMAFFFPVTAYEQVKAIAYPASDWRRRLVAAYKRDIRALHEHLGGKAESAKLVRLDVPDPRARWVEPNEESNKLGYWRVYGTRIIYEVDGGERALDVTSLISWRGEWYVVHLTGFK